MKTIRLTTMILAALLFCSCRQNLFMQRKYTKGIYFDPYKEINEPVAIHNSKKAYASAEKMTKPEKKEPVLLEAVMALARKEISAAKKDSLIIKKAPGKTVKIFKAACGPDVTITLDADSQLVRTKIVEYINGAKTTTTLGKNNELISKKVVRPKTSGDYKHKDLDSLEKWAGRAHRLFWLPLLGFIFALSARRKYKKAVRRYPGENVEASGKKIQRAIWRSVPFFLIGIVIACAALVVFAALIVGLMILGGG